MAALLVGMAVAAVLMTAAMPTWRQMVRREREAELIFRGQQYVRAITLFQRKSGPGTLPPDLDTLVNGRFLRKKFKDPVTNEDFDLLSPAQAAGTTGAVGGAGGVAGQQQAGRGGQPATTSGAVIAGQAPGGRGAVGGIIGVASKSKDASIRIYNGRAKYNEWQFIFVQQQAPAAGGGGVPGQRGAGPGGRGAGPQAPQGGFQGVGGGRQGGPGRGNPPIGQPPQGRGGAQAPPSPFGGAAPSPFAPRGGR